MSIKDAPEPFGPLLAPQIASGGVVISTHPPTFTTYDPNDHVKDPPPRPPSIRFFVPGLPAPGGSKTAQLIRRKGGAIVTTAAGRPLITMRDAGVRNKEWRATVAMAGRLAYAGPPLTSPLSVKFEFVLPRPKNHCRGGDRARGLRPTAPDYHTSKPDVLKLARSTEDALTGIIWHDDCQTVELRIEKRYGETPGAHIEITVRP